MWTQPNIFCAANANISRLTFSLNVVFSLYANTLYHPRLVLCRLDYRNIPNPYGHCRTFSLGQHWEQEASRRNETTFDRRQRFWIRIIANSFANLNCSLWLFSLLQLGIWSLLWDNNRFTNHHLLLKRVRIFCNVLKSFSLNLLHLDVNHLPSRIYNVVWQRIILSSL